LIFLGDAEHACCSIAGKIAAKFIEPGPGAFLDRLSSFRVCCMQCFHAGLEARGVEGIDGECAVATLRAPRFAGEPWAGARGGFGERRIHNLD